MAIYTTLTTHSAASLAARYEVVVDHAEALQGGQGNSNYLVRGPGGAFVLTVVDAQTMAEVQVVARVVSLLNEHGVRVPPMVPAPNGAFVTSYEGKPVVLKRYVEGDVGDRLSHSVLVELGRELARVHAVPPPPGLPRWHASGVEAFRQLATLAPDHEFTEWLAQQSEAIPPTTGDMPVGLIHGDIFCDNVVVRDGRLAAILDFENACLQPLLFDLAMAIVGTCRREARLSWDDAAHLVSGYQDVRQLMPVERQLLKVWTGYAAAATAFWRFRQYEVLYPELVDQTSYVDMRDLAEHIQAMKPDHFRTGVFGPAA